MLKATIAGSANSPKPCSMTGPLFNCCTPETCHYIGFPALLHPMLGRGGQIAGRKTSDQACIARTGAQVDKS